MEKVGRNDPCPCGSGRLFKKCCRNSGSFRWGQPGLLLSGTEHHRRPSCDGVDGLQ
ncbi:MAG: SEC-C metal-binding domain-containing protein [Gemmataceae bacterium]